MLGETALTAEASDPARLGWMQGFPPPADKLVMQPESDFFSFPKMRWTVCHIRELMPTKQVSRGLSAPVPLTYALDRGIDSVSFVPMGAEAEMSWAESLAANYTDGLLGRGRQARSHVDDQVIDRFAGGDPGG